MSDRAMRATFALLSTVGLGVAGYLTYVHYAGLTPVCGISHGCETVQTSSYAFLGGVPVALLGLVAYSVLLATALRDSEQAVLAGFGLAVVGFAFSAYLTYREIFTIHAICSWCASSAVIFTLLAALGTARVLMLRPHASTAELAAGGSGI